MPLGKHSINIIGPFVDMLLADGKFPSFVGNYTMNGFRNGGSESMDRAGVPQWLRSTYQGHTASKSLQLGAGGHGDSQLKNYSHKLGTTVEDMFRMAIFLSSVPSPSLHWSNLIPDEENLLLIRANLPCYIQMASADV